VDPFDNWNVYDQTSDMTMRNRWLAIVALIESLGLVNLLRLTQRDRGQIPSCPCRDPECGHVETFRHRNAHPDKLGYFNNDYLFATPKLAERLTRLEVRNETEA
jgi:hypothetical protein